jgi:hypothetical protein
MAETLISSGADAAPAAAPPAATPAPAQGSAADPRAWLPDVYREDPTFKDLADINALAKSYKHAAQMVGLDKAKVLRLPGSDDAPEWGDVYNALGRPEKPEDYGLQAPVESLQPEVVNAFAAKAHELGLSKKQAAGVLAYYGETASGLAGQATEALAVQATQSEATLKAEWGERYEDNLHAARRALREGASQALIDKLNRTGFGNDPDLIKLLARAGSATSEPPALKGGSTGVMDRKLTPADAKGQLAAMEQNSDTMAKLMNKDHPGHQAALAERRRLMAMAFPG